MLRGSFAELWDLLLSNHSSSRGTSAVGSAAMGARARARPQWGMRHTFTSAIGWEEAAAGFPELPKGRSLRKVWIDPGVRCARRAFAPSAQRYSIFPAHRHSL